MWKSEGCPGCTGGHGEGGGVKWHSNGILLSFMGVLERAVKDWHTATGHRWAVKWVKILNATMFQCHQAATNLSSLLLSWWELSEGASFHLLWLKYSIWILYTKSIKLISFWLLSVKLFASFVGYQRHYNLWQFHSVSICSWCSVAGWQLRNASSQNRSDFYALYHT